MADTMSSFAAEQYTNILLQMITAYPGVWNVYTSLSLNSFSGTPVGLYPDPAVSEPGLLRLLNGGKYTAIPLANISAVNSNQHNGYRLKIIIIFRS
jgi:hypothetical protein